MITSRSLVLWWCFSEYKQFSHLCVGRIYEWTESCCNAMCDPHNIQKYSFPEEKKRRIPDTSPLETTTIRSNSEFFGSVLNLNACFPDLSNYSALIWKQMTAFPTSPKNWRQFERGLLFHLACTYGKWALQVCFSKKPFLKPAVPLWSGLAMGRTRWNLWAQNASFEELPSLL